MEIKDQLQIMNEFKGMLMEIKETTNSVKQAIKGLSLPSCFNARQDIIIAGGKCSDIFSPLKSLEMFSWSKIRWVIVKSMPKCR